MNRFNRLFLTLSLFSLPMIASLRSQEALEIKGDQDSSAEPTPIPEHKAREPKPPAESESEPEATPKKKAKGPAKTVEEMSPDEFKKAGLDKLSPDELRTLNEWLKGYRAAAEQKA